MNISRQELERYISENRSDDFFRSLGFSRGRQDAIDAFSGGFGENPVERLIKETTAKYEAQVKEYNKKYSEFEQNNPFVFDTILQEERGKAKQRLDPYYEQTLGDYLTGVNTKRQRGLEDERTLLSELNQDTDQFIGDEKKQLDDTLEKSRQGFADAGMYDSGKRIRAEGEAEADSNRDISDTLQSAQRRSSRITLGNERLNEDLTLDESLKRRDLLQDQTYQTDIQALPEVERRRTQREFERGQYTGAPAGVDPMTFQNNLYSMLR